MFDVLSQKSDDVLRMNPSVLDSLIEGAVRVKAEVVTADERESDLRRILNFGHTIGHAMEAETEYKRFLHGEAVAWGMLAATELARLRNMLPDREADRIAETIHAYGPLPAAGDLEPDRLVARLGSDKKTLQGKVHFVLPSAIGTVHVVSGIEPALIREATARALRSRL
jgi:3-dehydroquinate synthase